MDPPGTDRDGQQAEQTPSTPSDGSANAWQRRRGSGVVQSFGIMPMLLGVAALVVLGFLLFSRDPAPNQTVEPRTQTQTAPK